jgi:phage shock protein E
MQRQKPYNVFRIFILSLIAGVLFSGCTPEPTPTGSISVIELEQRLATNEAPLILDVRSADEYSAGHLPAATNIPHEDVATRLAELPADKNAEIVVHCHSGRRAAIAETTLEEAGFTNVRHLDGDFVGWLAADLPLE